jgi:hypothetical protein
MLFLKFLMLLTLFSFFSFFFYVLSKTGAKEGAKEATEEISEKILQKFNASNNSKVFVFLENNYLNNCCEIEKFYYKNKHDGIVEFTDEKGYQRKIEFRLGVNINEFKS